MPNLGEHKTIGDYAELKGLASKNRNIVLKNGIKVSFGDIAGLAGDFISPSELKIVSLGNDEQEKQKRFLSAYKNLADNEDYVEFITEMLKCIDQELEGIADVKKRGGTAAEFYRLNAFIRDFTWFTLTTDLESKVQNYAEMALHNVDHFADSALECYRVGHTLAIAAMERAFSLKDDIEKFTEALMYGYSLEAFAFHYLTDYFTAGHMRVPRRELYHQYNYDLLSAGSAAGYHHDEDGRYGLNVTNQNGDIWKVYGDCQLLDDCQESNIQARDVIKQALKCIIDDLYNIASTGHGEKDNPAYKYLPVLHGDNISPMFRVKAGSPDQLERRVNLTDRFSTAYTDKWDLNETIDELYSLSAKPEAPLVEKGDWITVSKSPVQTKKIEWSQDFGQPRSAIYFLIPYIAKGKLSGSLFIEDACYEKFLSQCKPVDDAATSKPNRETFKIMVNDDFQYGQDKDKTMRFLVYHNKENKPYQNRFIETSFFTSILPTGFKDFLGDELKNF